MVEISLVGHEPPQWKDEETHHRERFAQAVGFSETPIPDRENLSEYFTVWHDCRMFRR
jgi:hypothetical protein